MGTLVQGTRGRVRIGPAGWSYPDWEGVVYPKPKPRGFHPLPYLAQFFDCIEINSSFYGVPSRTNTQRWLHLVEDRPDFRFFAKLHQCFTHGPVLDPTGYKSQTDAFREGFAPLLESQKLGGLLLQFPVQFRATGANCDRLKQLLDTWSEVSCAVELRHRSWFVPKGLEWLRVNGAELLHVDLPQAADHPPDLFQPTGRLGYLRLHGRNQQTWFQPGVGRNARYDYLYSPKEVDSLTKKIKHMSGQYDEVYVITNNHFAGQAIANAIEIQAGLDVQDVRAPVTLLDRYPRLRKCAAPHGQQQMF